MWRVGGERDCECGGHVEDRAWCAARDVEWSVDGLPDGEREHVGGGDVVYVDEVALLAAVFEDVGSFVACEGTAEDAGDAGVGGVAGHAGPVDIVVAQGRDGDVVVFPG